MSLHLVPLASLYHVRAYYSAAQAGIVISLLTYTGIVSPYQVAWLGGGLSAVMWCTATYLVWKANEIAAAAAKEPWAV